MDVKKKLPTASRNNCWSEFAYAHAPIRSATARQTDLTVFWSFESCSLNVSKVCASKRLLNQKITFNIKNKVQQKIADLHEGQPSGTCFQINQN